VGLLLLDTLRELRGVVAQRFRKGNFEFERYLLTRFGFLGLGQRGELIAHGSLLNLLPHCITQ
jgi:hypothetical protein